MIYISTGGFYQKDGFQASVDLIDSGCCSIELSGGKNRANLIHDLKSLRDLACFSVHNYFPPPEIPFVLNLGSLDEDIAHASMEHVKKAIRCAVELDQELYSVHAGFLIDPKVEELGKGVKQGPLFERSVCLARFIDRVNLVDAYAQSLGVKILIENNVLSANNYNRFGANPFLMTNVEECIFVMRETSDNVGLLIDVAHLKVSAKSLGFDPINFLMSCHNWIGGYHLSDNDGTRDSNDRIDANSWFWKYLRRDLDYYSLEIYGVSPSELVQQHNLVTLLLGNFYNEASR